ncbi:MAG TPA: transposase family protein [Candidatus Propionivibrio aalborgensis]|jgi:transposase|nr:transposase family protein [Candidatus Propionivibrio aalborgensis]
MPVNVLNLPGLRVLDFKETDTDYHVKAQPTVVSKLCPHCGRSNETVAHAQKTLFIRDLLSHGKSVAIHLDVPRLRCKPCNKGYRSSSEKFKSKVLQEQASNTATLLTLDRSGEQGGKRLRAHAHDGGLNSCRRFDHTPPLG